MPHTRTREFMRFCVVGGLAFIVDALILEFLVLGNVPALTARILSIAIAMQVSYVLHRRFTFRGAHTHNPVRWGKFMASNLIGATINYGVFAGMLHMALSDDAQTARLIALISGTAIALMFNYWMNRCYVFTAGAGVPTLFRRMPIALLAILAIAIPHLIYGLSKWYAIPLHEGVPIGQTDPDTWLRLTLVRDWLAGGSWYDHSVAHSNAPLGGITSPWTRPLDMVLALFAKLQPESVDVSVRLMRASLLLPVLWMALLVAGIHRAIRAIMPLPSAYVMASVMVVTLPMLWNYFSLGNADHHAPLAALFIWAMGGVLTTTPSRRLMLFTGALLGLQLWISVEALILIAMIYMWYGLSWLRGDAAKAWQLSWLATGTAFTALIALLIEHPIGAWHIPIYDSISIAHVFALTCAALFAWALHVVPTQRLRARVLVAAIGSASLLVVIALTYPKLLLGPMVDVAPFIISDFLPRISEAKPFYKIAGSLVAAMLIVPLLGLTLCVAGLYKKQFAFYSAQHSAALSFFLLGTLALYLCQQRWSYYLLPLAIVAIAPVLGALLTPEHGLVSARWPNRMLLGLTPNEQARRRLPFILGVLSLPFAFVVAGADSNISNTPAEHMASAKNITLLQTKQRDDCYQAARQLIRGGELARVLPKNPLAMLAPTDLATEILFFTPHRIVASNYHREGVGIAYVWGADKITDTAALRAHLRERKIAALLLCPTVDPEKNSLLQAYVHGTALPTWLTRVDYSLQPIANAATDDKKMPPIALIPPLLLRVTLP